MHISRLQLRYFAIFWSTYKDGLTYFYPLHQKPAPDLIPAINSF